MAEQFNVGEFTVRTIVDFADQEWPASLLIPDSTAELLEDDMYAPAETYNSETEGLRLRFGGHLFEADGRTVLVDCGVGAGKARSPHPDWNMREDTSFLDSLRENGYRPEDIDVMVTTHAHVDHVGWLTVRSETGVWEPTFPRAEYVFARLELDHWLTAHETEPDVNFGSTSDSIVPLMSRAKVTRVEDGHEIAPGVTLRVYPGHTPGNAAVWLESAGESAVICGDTVHHPIQLRYPEWSSGFCLDPRGSAGGRRTLLDEVAERGSLLMPNHVRLPPVQIAKSADHYEVMYA